MRSNICILLLSIIGWGSACVPPRAPKSLYSWAGLYWNQCICEFKFQDIKMALILHPGLRYLGLDYPALSGLFFIYSFPLCVFVIAWLTTKAAVPELCQAAEKYVCTRASTTCFYWKPRYWGKCLEFPRSSGFGEMERKGEREGEEIISIQLPFPPQTARLPGNAQ